MNSALDKEVINSDQVENMTWIGRACLENFRKGMMDVDRIHFS